MLAYIDTLSFESIRKEIAMNINPHIKSTMI